jgi:hypothetical protein
VLLIVPNVILFSGDSDKSKLPEFGFKNLSQSVKDFNTYYDNNYGLKPQLVDSYLKFKTQVLDDTPLPNRVIKGKDDWYFLGNQYNELFNDSFGNFDFSEAELIEIKDFLQSTREVLAARGIAFYIVVPPNKHRVYTEMLPYQLNYTDTRLKTLNSYLKKEIDFEIIDLRDTLIVNKNLGQLYYKTDTHWNDLGAFLGYQKTMSIIAPDLPTVSLSEYTIANESTKQGDITEMINLKTNEQIIALHKNEPSQIKSIKSTYEFMRFVNYKRNKILVMYRDSFGNALIPFFNESFRETIYKRGYPVDLGFIDHKKPDIVIFEVVERNLSSILLNRKKSPK